jgi:Ca2+-binding EF-hand superfamily protein
MRSARLPHAMIRLAAAALVLLLSAAPLRSQQAPPQAPPTVTDEQLRATFNAADANRDGVIDVDEVVADAILVFGRFDTNKDGYLTSAELPRHSPERFRRADRDGDGKLSLGEVAADRVFEFFVIDTNRNGVLSFEEVRAYADSHRNARK